MAEEESQNATRSYTQSLLPTHLFKGMTEDLFTSLQIFVHSRNKSEFRIVSQPIF